MDNETVMPHHFQPKPKIELSMFDGKEANYCVRQCDRYFDYDNTVDRDKIEVAALYFGKKVEKWFHNQLVG